MFSHVLCFPLTEYIAMYTYESSEQGDLTFQQGDMILVTKKDGDWWTGTLGDKSGVFPSNYVRLKDSEVETYWNVIKLSWGKYVLFGVVVIVSSQWIIRELKIFCSFTECDTGKGKQ